MTMKIDIICRELIKPSSPTPSYLNTYNLSLYDQANPPNSYVPLVLFYSLDHQQTAQVKKAEISYALRRSLSEALTQFYPLAGRISSESSVDCNDKGINYIEAKVDSQVSDILKKPEVDLLNQFIPLSGDREEQILLAIQVNFFNCGGMAIGICVSHKIADGFSLSTFIKSWASNARGEVNLVCPSFVSATLFPPKVPLSYKPIPQVPEAGLTTRRLIFSASEIAALKAEVAKTMGVEEPTRVEVVTARIWKCFLAQTVLKSCRKSVAFHPVNIRKRMVPELPQHSFGNLFLMAIAVADGGEDLCTLVAKLRDAINKINCDYIRERLGENGFELFEKNYKKIGEIVTGREVQVIRFTSWCGFRIYEADFGWGQPKWVSSTGMNATKNCVLLMDSRYSGGVEAWVTLPEQDMSVLIEQNPNLQTEPWSFSSCKIHNKNSSL